MKYLSLLFILLLSEAVIGQKTFTEKEIRQDIDFFIETLENVHPNPYTIFPKTHFIKELQAFKYELNYPYTKKTFYSKLAPIIAKLGDAHTGIYYYPQDNLLFPLELKKIQNRIVVSADFSSDQEIEIGTELISINDISTFQIIDSLTSFISAEDRSLKEDFLLTSEFPYLLYIVYNFKDKFKLSFKDKDSDIPYIKEIEGILSDTIDRIKENQKKEKFSTSFCKDEDWALITISTFEYDCLDEFKVFLKRAFGQIKENSISNLIVDIRENDGGSSSLGDELLKYISDTEFCQESKEILKISKAYLNQNTRNLMDSIGSIKTTVTGLNNLIKPFPNRKRFNGQLFVLIGPHTFSAGSEFAGAIKDYRLGVFVGDETGGRATSFGEMLGFFLPNTRFRFGISSKKFFRPNQIDDGKGVIPDYFITQNYDDYCQNKDTALEFTKKLIQNRSI